MTWSYCATDCEVLRAAGLVGQAVPSTRGPDPAPCTDLALFLSRLCRVTLCSCLVFAFASTANLAGSTAG